MKNFIKWWRIYGVIVLIALQLLCFFIEQPIGIGIATIMLVTVPCNMKIFNKYKLLWYARQAAFIFAGMLHIYPYLTWT
jgi:hypothetical protein